MRRGLGTWLEAMPPSLCYDGWEASLSQKAGLKAKA